MEQKSKVNMCVLAFPSERESEGEGGEEGEGERETREKSDVNYSVPIGIDSLAGTDSNFTNYRAFIFHDEY